jgi:hypothetical protein
MRLYQVNLTYIGQQQTPTGSLRQRSHTIDSNETTPIPAGGITELTITNMAIMVRPSRVEKKQLAVDESQLAE